ncbi:MAG: hypothetical protein EAZ83_01540 [Oscillatoriales cyanobacterium]|nr:MAG: hypothetical protein EAZ83_01540 [Oscillatoriales cyanobacterium]TAE98189.1 MAG: hypothetical protein EAZ79_08250 [Oscillatoriales cyanobacterium]TAF35291.1 MAG: hypothetical protein EAZ69_13180 [Oscillatoriales cyanobacterium]
MSFFGGLFPQIAQQLFYDRFLTPIGVIFLRTIPTNCPTIILRPILDTNWCHFFEDYSDKLPNNYSTADF